MLFQDGKLAAQKVGARRRANWSSGSTAARVNRGGSLIWNRAARTPLFRRRKKPRIEAGDADEDACSTRATAVSNRA